LETVRESGRAHGRELEGASEEARERFYARNFAEMLGMS
jgi:hypothetical protein